MINPSQELTSSLVRFLATSPLIASFKFPDQDLLAAYFEGKWKVLPWCYNALKTLRIIHQPLWRDDEIRCLHYILPEKPWRTPPGTAGEHEEVNEWWWNRYNKLAADLQQSHPEDWKLIDAHVTKA